MLKIRDMKLYKKRKELNMDAGELYFYINDKLWQLEWCQGDYCEEQQILQEIEYALGALRI